jgi:hypothetical protein
MCRAFVACVQIGLQSPKLVGRSTREHAMSRRLLILALAALTSFVRVGSIAAQELGTPDQAKAKPGTTEPAAKQFLETRVDNQGCGVAYYQ